MSARNRLLVASAIGLLIVGCATQSARPTGEIARARTLIEQAERAGAQSYAAADLDQARSKLQLADAAEKDGKHEDARARANEAAASAELAMARTNAGEAQKAADEVQQSVETLRTEAQRDTHGALPPTTPSPNTVPPPAPPPNTP